MITCGACKGETTHARLCHKHPEYTYWLTLARRAEDLADAIGSNNAGLANRFYAGASELRGMHEALLKDRKLSRQLEET